MSERSESDGASGTPIELFLRGIECWREPTVRSLLELNQ